MVSIEISRLSFLALIPSEQLWKPSSDMNHEKTAWLTEILISWLVRLLESLYNWVVLFHPLTKRAAKNHCSSGRWRTLSRLTPVEGQLKFGTFASSARCQHEDVTCDSIFFNPGHHAKNMVGWITHLVAGGERLESYKGVVWTIQHLPVSTFHFWYLHLP